MMFALYFVALTWSQASAIVSYSGTNQEIAASLQQEAYLKEQIAKTKEQMSSEEPSPEDFLALPSDSNSSPSTMPASALQSQDAPMPTLANNAKIETALASSQDLAETPGRATSELVQQGRQVLKGPRPLLSRQHEYNDQALELNLNSKTAPKKPVDIKTVRPSAHKGVPEIVTFGLFAKAFFGAMLKNNKFSMDTVLVLQWKDPRVAQLVPDGTDRLSMSGKMASLKIWMPDVVVTNRDIGKYDKISTSVTMYKTGEVMMVERAGVVLNMLYELDQYPFDAQKLAVKVASSKYMLDEVELKASEDKTHSGVNAEIFDGSGYQLSSWKVFAFKETDGALKKSRGVLEVTVSRTFNKYSESHLMPASLLLVISWGVFWFPFQNPFITPRLALSILALLSFTTLMIKSSSALPGGAPHNWNDTLNQQVQAMMFCTIVLNIFSELCKHQLKVEALAVSINHEAKVLLPILSITVCILAMGSGAYGWMTLSTAGIVSKALIGIVMGIYLASAMARLGKAQGQDVALKAAA